MGLNGFLQLEGADLAAFVISGLAGYAAGTYLSSGDWAVYISILVSYHLFLAWLVLNRPKSARLSMPLWLALPTHAACMVVALGPAVVGEHGSIVFRLFRYGIAGLAIFEAGSIFSERESSSTAVDSLGTEPQPVTMSTSAEDEIAWLEYLQTRRPGQMKFGTTIREEKEAWLRARQKKQLAAAAAAATISDSQPLAEPHEGPVYQAG